MNISHIRAPCAYSIVKNFETLYVPLGINCFLGNVQRNEDIHNTVSTNRGQVQQMELSFSFTISNWAVVLGSLGEQRQLWLCSPQGKESRG